MWLFSGKPPSDEEWRMGSGRAERGESGRIEVIIGIRNSVQRGLAVLVLRRSGWWFEIGRRRRRARVEKKKPV